MFCFPPFNTWSSTTQVTLYVVVTNRNTSQWITSPMFQGSPYKTKFQTNDYNENNMEHKSICNQKERVRKYTAHWLPSANPGVHVLLIYSTQFKPLIIHNSLTAYWIITRSEMCKSFAPTQQQSIFYSIRPLPRPSTQMSTKGTFSLHYRLYTFPKAQAFFPLNVHKNTNFPVLCSLSLSLSSPFVVVWLITRCNEKF
jgi:hypothetical protein